MSDIEVVPLCVRAARADDLDAVLAVHDLHLGRPSPRPPTERERASWDLMMNTPGATVYLGWIGGDAVGTATAVLIPSVASDGAPSVLVEAVVTVPHRRRQGIATAIMGEISPTRERGAATRFSSFRTSATPWTARTTSTVGWGSRPRRRASGSTCDGASSGLGGLLQRAGSRRTAAFWWRLHAPWA